MTQHIAIIGAGYAGLSAGVCLASHGYCVKVFEAAKALGGRARTVNYQNMELDNGQHICLGAYTGLLKLTEQVGIQESDIFIRQPLELTILPDFRLTLSRLSAPWHLLFGLLRCQGLSWIERWQLAGTMQALKHSQPTTDMSVAQWLSTQRQSAHLQQYFWIPLCLATLNTPPAQASAQLFLNVLRDSLGKPAHASDLLLPRVGLSSVFPDKAAGFIAGHGGKILTGKRVQAITSRGRQWQIEGGLYDHVILAVAPQQLAGLQLPPELSALTASVAKWQYQAIATLYLQYPDCVRLPRPMQGMINTLSQWIFDRGQTHQQQGLIAVVISAPAQKVSQEQLTRKVVDELQQFFNIQVSPIWCKVITEKRATFSAEVNLQRPTQKTGMTGLWLAGDYTMAAYPATIEGAIQSGIRSSELIMEQSHE